MTIARHASRRSLVAAVGILITAAGISGCEPSKDFSITNATDQTLTVQQRIQLPGQAISPRQPGDLEFTLQPGETFRLQLSLDKGACTNNTFLARDQNGLLVNQDPAPICRDKNGHGNSWTINKK